MTLLFARNYRLIDPIFRNDTLYKLFNKIILLTNTFIKSNIYILNVEVVTWFKRNEYAW